MIDINVPERSTLAVQDSLTVLSHEVCVLTKHWFYGPTGPTKKEYDGAKYFSAGPLYFTGIYELAALLEILADAKHSMVIRGEILPTADPTHLRRANKPKDGEPPGFREVPRRWVMLDFDNISVDCDYLADPESAVKEIVKRLPRCLHDVTCFWQVSSSCGISTHKKGFGCHIWFVLDRPMADKELKRWATNHNDSVGTKLIDLALFQCVQAHYTANPVIDVGVTDPFLGRRTGVLRGYRDVASLPATIGGKRDGWCRKLETLQDPGVAHHEVIRNASYMFFCELGAEADQDVFRTVARPALDEACTSKGQDIWEEQWLDDLIDSGCRAAKERLAAGDDLLVDGQGKILPTLSNCVKIITAHPDWQGVLGYNERTLQVLFLKEPPWISGNTGTEHNIPRAFVDVDSTRLCTWFGSVPKLAITKNLAFDAALAFAQENSFEPVRDYLTGLEWDGQKRIDTWAIRHFGSADTEYVRLVSRAWLISAAARALKPGCQVDTLLVLEGAQGYLKSQFLKTLAGVEHMSDQLPDITTIAAKQHCHGPWITEVKEWQRFKGKDASAIKGFIDLQWDQFRAPYARTEERHLRSLVFAATTNEKEYLTDGTGNRRFWPVATTRRADIALVAAERDQLWAEAVAAYHAGEKWWFEADDKRFTVEQEDRMSVDSWESNIAQAVVCGAKSSSLPSPTTEEIKSECERVSTAQILEHLFNIPIDKHTNSLQQRVANTLRDRLNWQRKKISINGRQQYFYCKT